MAGIETRLARLERKVPAERLWGVVITDPDSALSRDEQVTAYLAAHPEADPDHLIVIVFVEPRHVEA